MVAWGRKPRPGVAIFAATFALAIWSLPLSDPASAAEVTTSFNATFTGTATLDDTASYYEISAGSVLPDTCAGSMAIIPGPNQPALECNVALTISIVAGHAISGGVVMTFADDDDVTFELAGRWEGDSGEYTVTPEDTTATMEQEGEGTFTAEFTIGPSDIGEQNVFPVKGTIAGQVTREVPVTGVPAVGVAGVGLLFLGLAAGSTLIVRRRDLPEAQQDRPKR